MSGKKILIVDDSKIVLRALSMKLQSSGYEVLTAEDGSEAVSIARRARPDLILLDISFPPDVAHGGGVAWDGFLVMEWMKRLEEAQNIPVMIITGGDPVEYQARAMAAGAVRFFIKPIDTEELLNSVHEVLGDGASEVPPQ
jgi:two-component system response regulator AtoC/two-component system nitrogen regulation response regulator NtrX